MKSSESIFLTLAFSFAAFLPLANANDTERPRPPEWKNLVQGGQFKDLFLPMPVRDELTADTWGGDNVKPRDISNGIEDPAWSYWCGDPTLGEDGKYHLYSSRWPEDEPRGHFGYFDSIIVHAEADDPMGPYTYKDTIGPGHNPELYRTRKGDYMIYSTHGRFYSSKSLTGPWTAGTYNFDKRERYAFKNYVNFSFAPRDDGSFIAVSRRGYIWASKDGGEDWSEVSSESVYPKVEGIFEDPVMWKDDIQYHIIVNDWKGRIAYHLRSKDGFHWKSEPGEAYVPGIARYEDGTRSEWYKFERLRFLQDDHGRPTHAHFAVIDTEKKLDQPNDIHNSKLIVIPMTVPRLCTVLNKQRLTEKTEAIRVNISAEAGFDPQRDIDLDSLRFGASEEVNYGRGSKLISSEKVGSDLILTFSGKDTGITKENFAGKLLGKSTDGKLLFGWAALPGTKAQVPLLSPLSPKFEFTPDGTVAYVEIQNFGEIASKASTVRLLSGDRTIGTGSVRTLEPFEKSIVRIVCGKPLKKGTSPEITVLVESAGYPTESFRKKVQLPKN
ncbi:glycoside hydrolase family protein [Luteolibacter algae]|uniref:Glycoside hydrolase family protein n=1 Tax=Luteolibacter algae TaxID=454151 RepID=A0ABW5D6X0_9BACT